MKATTNDDGTWTITTTDENLARFMEESLDLNDRIASELDRLSKGIEKVAAKYGADHPEVADALHRLLRGAA